MSTGSDILCAVSEVSLVRKSFTEKAERIVKPFPLSFSFSTILILSHGNFHAYTWNLVFASIQCETFPKVVSCYTNIKGPRATSIFYFLCTSHFMLNQNWKNRLSGSLVFTCRIPANSNREYYQDWKRIKLRGALTDWRHSRAGTYSQP